MDDDLERQLLAHRGGKLMFRAIVAVPALWVLCAFAGRVEVSAQTPAPPACAAPNVDAGVVTTVPAVTPPAAIASGIGGEVVVLVSLDENSKIVSAFIAQSPSALLNNAALAAATHTVFRTRVENCKPVAGRYRFLVFFNVKPPAISDYFLGTWYCASELKANVVKAYGLAGNGTALRLLNPYVTADGVIASQTELYTENGGGVNVMSPSGNSAFMGTSPGWSGNTLTFIGVVTGSGGAPLTQRETYTRVDDDRFLRVFEMLDAGTAAWTTTSRETCARIARPIPAPSPVPSP